MFPRTFERVFEVWRYTVGHGQMLLRSTKPDVAGTRVDVGFTDVVYIQLPTLVHITSIRVAEAFEVPAFLRDVPHTAERTVYLIESGQSRFFVAAGFAEWHEDEREYHEPSSVLPGLA